ncbi:MAG: nucleotidyltransferase domain-containing protein [Candidatus Zhuqueibacterota bacterium]
MDKVQTIVSKFNPDKIILFGSYAEGKPTEESDLDLLVILTPKHSTFQTSVEISLAMTHNYPLDIIVRTPAEIKRRLKSGDFFINNIIKNGKVLNERVSS